MSNFKLRSIDFENLTSRDFGLETSVMNSKELSLKADQD